ncbi:hypothetical protein SUGI_0001290 [Cryptomeria japonica]|uniref:ent-kaurenoic acid oxidase 2-like n=1 Tax=Cryptomeria japonica TaxID=3369 RepID=UPI002408C2AA|nr:ent-kaurenoic acid oxidase 2-like [Cryptomeria japonica]GLJ04686.1 hypothetical protein SUGI_0001290 [Cryptomeria japonica]
MDTLWLIGLAVTVGLFPPLIWVLRSFNEWKYCHQYSTSKTARKLPPGHMGWPIIGELLDFLWCFKFTLKPDDFIWKRRAKYGDTGIYRTHLFGSPSIITCSPEANRFVTARAIEDDTFAPGWPSPELIGVNSIAMVEGLQHKRIRRYLMEAVNSPESLARIFVKLQPLFKAALKNWALKGSITAADEANQLTFHNICTLLFSYSNAPLLEKMERIYRGLRGGIRAQPINLPGTALHHALKCRKELSSILLSEMHDRRVNKENSKDDFLQVLMDSVDSNGDKLSEEEILDNIVSIILGGYASTANSITWALYYLAKYPAVLQKLKEENVSIRLKKKEDEILTYEDVKSMDYTSKVIDEVIRLANISAFVFRTASKDEEFNGYTIPKGWKVIVWLRANHVDPQYYHNPMEFNPDRWDGLIVKLGVYYVFGGGPRLCPGNNLVRMELFMFLHQVCIDYKWELSNPNASIHFLPYSRAIDGVKMTFRDM